MTTFTYFYIVKLLSLPYQETSAYLPTEQTGSNISIYNLRQRDYVFGGQQDYTKTTERIPSKLGQRMRLSPEQTTLTFGTDSEKGTDPGNVF